MATPIKHRGKWRIRWIDAEDTRRSEVFDDFNDAKRALRARQVEADEIRAGRGYDTAGRTLDLGDQYTHTLGGVLEHAPCGDMDFICPLAGDMVVANAAGRGTLTATFHGLTATRDVVAIAPPDAGAD